MQDDQLRLSREITRWTAQEVFEIARRALTDLASANLEDRIVDVFVQRLRGLDGGGKESLTRAVKESTEPTIVRSTFDLGSPQRACIQKALNETCAAEVPLRFDTTPDIIGGLELTANGQKLAWCIGEYLSGLEQKVSSLLDTQAAPTPAPAPQAVATPVHTPVAVSV